MTSPSLTEARETTLNHEIAQAWNDESGISGFTGSHGTLVRFDTRHAEARAAIVAMMDRLAYMPPKPAPVVVTDAHRAAVLAQCPGAKPDAVEALAKIEATFFGGRAA